MGRIALAAGLNKQLIYYYFGSKRELYAAAMRPRDIPVAPSSADPPTANAGIRQVVDGLLRDFSSRPEVVALLVDRGTGPDVGVSGRAVIARAQRDAAAALSRSQGLGHFRDDLDPESVARLAVVLCLGYLALAQHLDTGIDDWSHEVCDLLARVTAW